MAFYALMVGVLGMIVIGIGGVVFIIALILDIICGMKKRKGEEAGKIFKAVSVIMTVLGCLFFVIPVLFLGGVWVYSKAADNANLNSIEERYNVEYGWTEFDYKGVTYTEAQFLHPYKLPDDDAPVLALVFPDKDYREIYAVQSDLGFPVLHGRGFCGCFVPADRYEEARKYYLETSPLTATIRVEGADGLNDDVVCDLDGRIVRTLKNLVNTPPDSVFGPDAKMYYFEAYTADMLNHYYVNVAVDGGRVIAFDAGSEGQGALVPDDMAQEILRVISQYN